jgi:hypothetical protein
MRFSKGIRPGQINDIPGASNGLRTSQEILELMTAGRAFSSIFQRVFAEFLVCLGSNLPDQVQISLDFTMGGRSIVTFRSVKATH